MSDTWTMISARQKAMQKFYDQVDATRKRLNLEPYLLTDFDGKTKLDDVVNVTENRSASYMSRIIAGLISSKWQTVVDGSISKRDSFKIEQFIEANLQQADEYLMNQYGMAGLDVWLANHVCHTSLIGVEWISSIDDEGNYNIHCLPTDMRWTPFILNKWASPITWRDKEDLLEELENYDKTAKDSGDETHYYLKPDNLADTDNEVRDYWDKDVNELWVAEKLVFRQPNWTGKLPFVFVWPPSGFMFRDKGYLANESPGLLYLNQNLYDQLSRQLSIDATIGSENINPRYERPVKDFGGEPMDVPARGESQDVLEGELHQLVPRPDLNRAGLASRDEVMRLIEEANPLSPRAYTSPPSAIEVTTEVELLEQLQHPQVLALETFKAQLARLIIDQCLGLGRDSVFTIGAMGRQKDFRISDLKGAGKYTITCTMMKGNKRISIVNEARALAMWGRAPMEYILRDVWQVEDPDGWLRAMELERAKAANPAIELAEMAVRYAEEAENTEDETEREFRNHISRMLVHDYVMMMRQRMQPPATEVQNVREATKETGNANALIPLLGRAGGLGGQGVQSQGVNSGSQME